MKKIPGNWRSFGFLIALCTNYSVVKADVLHINAGLSTGHFIDGYTVTDQKPIVFVGGDWSFNNGTFSGADCYQSSSDRGESLSRGCHAYLGYFTKINDDQALTLELRHKRYLIRSGFFWTDTEATINWHINRRLTFAVTANDNWLDRGHATLSFKGDYVKPLNNEWSSYVSAGLLQFEGTSNIGGAEHFEFGLKYQKQRWGAEVSAIFSDHELGDLLGFDASQNQLRFTVSYRLY